MNYLGQLFEFLQRLIVWWVTIMPWEEAVHVRMGKKIRVLAAGLHLRIPFIDRVYVQTTRLRVIQCPVQTVTTRDGVTLTISMNMGYQIVNILKLYNTLYDAERTLCNMMHGITADEVWRLDRSECTPARLEEAVNEKMSGDDFGLLFKYMNITSFAAVRTYRLIQSDGWMERNLNTDQQKP